MDPDASILKIGDCIGKGVYSKVYKGIFKGEVVAVKKMRDSGIHNNVLHEIDVWKNLPPHENICKAIKLLVVNTSNGMEKIYITSELMSGNINGKLTQETFKSCFYQLINAVDHMHCHGFIHSDIKPENILIDSSNTRIKLTDFNLSTRWLPDNGKISLNSTYRIPRANGHVVTDQYIDIFNIGITMLLTYLIDIRKYRYIFKSGFLNYWKPNASYSHTLRKYIKEVKNTLLRDLLITILNFDNSYSKTLTSEDLLTHPYFFDTISLEDDVAVLQDLNIGPIIDNLDVNTIVDMTYNSSINSDGNICISNITPEHMEFRQLLFPICIDSFWLYDYMTLTKGFVVDTFTDAKELMDIIDDLVISIRNDYDPRNAELFLELEGVILPRESLTISHRMKKWHYDQAGVRKLLKNKDYWWVLYTYDFETILSLANKIINND